MTEKAERESIRIVKLSLGILIGTILSISGRSLDGQKVRFTSFGYGTPLQLSSVQMMNPTTLRNRSRTNGTVTQ